MKRLKILLGAAILAAATALVAKTPVAMAQGISAEEAGAIAKEAYVYGFPLVDNYRITYAYAVDKANKEYKGPFNTLVSEARVYTPDDRTIQSPNSDTPYSFFVTDLRAEPLVLTIPAMETNRYFSVQLIDAYTFNFDYLGTRGTGNDGGHYLLAGPNWNGEAPEDVEKTMRSETDMVLGIYRTQLFGADDLPKVKKIQDGYKLQTLSDFLKQPAPPAAPAIDFIKPLAPQDERTSLDFFNMLRFVLDLSPAHPSEVALRERFKKIGLEPGKSFSVASMPADIQAALKQGMADGQKEIDVLRATDIPTSELFGTRADMNNNYLNRALGTQKGIYGNSKEEAFYAGWAMEADGKTPVDTGKNEYAIRFAPGQLPPVRAFWSVTMYDVPAQLLVANKLNRYLINSQMLPGLKKDEDGGLTIYVQKDSPGADKEANWLPAPDGRALIALRAYLPEAAILKGEWKPPNLERVN